MSAFFEANKNSYYQKLMQVRMNNKRGGMKSAVLMLFPPIQFCEVLNLPGIFSTPLPEDSKVWCICFE
jgi:hypothetical protein